MHESAGATRRSLPLLLLLPIVAASAAFATPLATVEVREMAGKSEPAPVVTFGQTFRAGDAPSAVQALVNGQSVPTQVDAKRRHADGSLRHAVISARLPALPAGGRVQVQLIPASSSSGTPLTVDAALAHGFDATVEITQAGKVYRASAASLLRAGAERWLGGSLVTEYHAQAAPLAGTSAHPALLVQFDVRFLSPDAARVEVAVDDSWPGATDQTYDVAVKVGAQEVLSQRGVRHYAQSRWMRAFTWGSVPRLHVRPDLRALIASGAAPTYDPAVVPTDAELQSWYDHWRANTLTFQAANAFALLGYGAVQPVFVSADEGEPLPWWAAQALTSGDPRPMEITLDSGERAGHFAVHFRSRTTGKVLSLDEAPAFPRVTSAIVKDASGKILSSADTAHQQSLAWLPYVLTGDRFYWEETQFWVAYNFFERPPEAAYRNGAEGLLHGGMTRSQAWSMRTLGLAAWIAPATDAPYLEKRVATNLAFYDRNFVDPAGAGHNLFGILDVGPIDRAQKGMEDCAADAVERQSSWNHDVFAWVAQWLVRLGYPAAPLRDYLLQNVQGRLLAPGVLKYDAFNGQYVAKNAQGLYSDWASMWRATFAKRPSTSQPKGYVKFGWTGCLFCYWQHGRAALVAAVDAGQPWARAAFDDVDHDLRATLTSSPSSRPSWALVPLADLGGATTSSAPPPAPPAAPSRLTASLVATGVDLAWTDNATDETSYQVEASSGDGAFAAVASTNADVTGIRLAGLRTGTRYRFRVRALNEEGPSAYSDEASVTTPGAPPPSGAAPPTPGNLTATRLLAHRVRLRWKGSPRQVRQYRVEMRQGDGAFEQILALGAARTTAWANELRASTAYDFRIRACNAAGCSPYSSTVTVRTLPR